MDNKINPNLVKTLQHSVIRTFYLCLPLSYCNYKTHTGKMESSYVLSFKRTIKENMGLAFDYSIKLTWERSLHWC